MQVWEDVQSQHKVGFHHGFGVSSSHAVSRNDYAFSISGFEDLGVGCSGNFFEVLCGVRP